VNQWFLAVAVIVLPVDSQPILGDGECIEEFSFFPCEGGGNCK
jgi:hypothetical protein